MAAASSPPRPPDGGALLGLDVGDVRIGVALSESRMICRPLPAIDRSAGRTATLNALEEIVRSHGVRTAVVGLPLLEGGAEGEQAARTRAFARSLRRRIPGLWVEMRDERYTSAEAADIIGGGPAEPGRVDSVAAAVILQEYLDELSAGS